MLRRSIQSPGCTLQVKIGGKRENKRVLDRGLQTMHQAGCLLRKPGVVGPTMKSQAQECNKAAASSHPDNHGSNINSSTQEGMKLRGHEMRMQFYPL